MTCNAAATDGDVLADWLLPSDSARNYCNTGSLSKQRTVRYSAQAHGLPVAFCEELRIRKILDRQTHEYLLLEPLNKLKMLIAHHAPNDQNSAVIDLLLYLWQVLF